MSKHDQKSIGKALQRARKDAGFKSANAFAEHVGMNPGTYRNYEQGDRPFTVETAWDMADALEVTLDELVGREWPQDGPPTLTADERKLVDDYRRADADDRPALASMAAAVAYAGEAKNEEQTRVVGLAGDDVRGGR